MVTPFSSGGLAGQLLDLDDDELRGLQWREPDEDVDHAPVDVAPSLTVFGETSV